MRSWSKLAVSDSQLYIFCPADNLAQVPVFRTRGFQLAPTTLTLSVHATSIALKLPLALEPISLAPSEDLAPG